MVLRHMRADLRFQSYQLSFYRRIAIQRQFCSIQLARKEALLIWAEKKATTISISKFRNARPNNSIEVSPISSISLLYQRIKVDQTRDLWPRENSNHPPLSQAFDFLATSSLRSTHLSATCCTSGACGLSQHLKC